MTAQRPGAPEGGGELDRQSEQGWKVRKGPPGCLQRECGPAHTLTPGSRLPGYISVVLMNLSSAVGNFVAMCSSPAI